MDADDIACQTDTTPRPRKRSWAKLAVLVVVVVALVLAYRALPLKQYLRDFVEWAGAFGAWGPIILGAAWIPVCVLMVPGSVLTLGTGFIFGLGIGIPTVSIGSTIGACIAFLVGRTVARSWISKKIEGNDKFRAIDTAIGREGWKIVFLTRLSPVFPFNLLNYALGITRVPFWHYALASWLGMIPGTVMYVYFGKAAQSVTAEVETGTAGRIFLYVGLVVTVVVTVFVTRVARKALDKAVREAGTTSGPVAE